MMTDNTAASRFERKVGDETVYAAYRLNGSTLSITYVEAPLPLRGTGEAGKLMKGVMDHARERNLKVMPICGYAAAWIKRHGEYNDLLG